MVGPPVMEPPGLLGSLLQGSPPPTTVSPPPPVMSGGETPAPQPMAATAKKDPHPSRVLVFI